MSKLWQSKAKSIALSMFLTASKYCGSGLKNEFVVVVVVVVGVVGVADELLSFKNKLTFS